MHQSNKLYICRTVNYQQRSKIINKSSGLGKLEALFNSNAQSNSEAIERRR